LRSMTSGLSHQQPFNFNFKET